ncbi:CHRD domain-containing protein [Myxococcaceae bacterium GXIMD 01537]
MHGRLGGRWALLAVSTGLLWLTGCSSDTAEETLTGDQEVPAVTTSATGDVTAELNGNTLEVSGSFSGLSSDPLPVSGSPGHVHKGARGQNGPILFNLTVTPNADNRSGTFSGSATLSDEDQNAFNDGLLYVNVHTQNNPGGEIRAQLEP